MAVPLPYPVATFYWSLLALSVVLTFITAQRLSWRIALLAAGTSLVCAIAGLASIGVLILLLTVLQLLLAGVLYRRARQ